MIHQKQPRKFDLWNKHHLKKSEYAFLGKNGGLLVTLTYI